MDYELAIEAANKPMVALEAAISADLDPEEGGIGWWNDQIGWRYSALSGAYLLSACSGVRASLADAPLKIEKYAETESSDQHWVRDGFARAATSGAGPGRVDLGPEGARARPAAGAVPGAEPRVTRDDARRRAGSNPAHGGSVEALALLALETAGTPKAMVLLKAASSAAANLTSSTWESARALAWLARAEREVSPS